MCFPPRQVRRMQTGWLYASLSSSNDQPSRYDLIRPSREFMSKRSRLRFKGLAARLLVRNVVSVYSDSNSMVSFMLSADSLAIRRARFKFSAWLRAILVSHGIGAPKTSEYSDDFIQIRKYVSCSASSAMKFIPSMRTWMANRFADVNWYSSASAPSSPSLHWASNDVSFSSSGICCWSSNTALFFITHYDRT